MRTDDAVLVDDPAGERLMLMLERAEKPAHVVSLEVVLAADGASHDGSRERLLASGRSGFCDFDVTQ